MLGIVDYFLHEGWDTARRNENENVVSVVVVVGNGNLHLNTFNKEMTENTLA